MWHACAFLASSYSRFVERERGEERGAVNTLEIDATVQDMRELARAVQNLTLCDTLGEKRPVDRLPSVFSTSHTGPLSDVEAGCGLHCPYGAARQTIDLHPGPHRNREVGEEMGGAVRKLAVGSPVWRAKDKLELVMEIVRARPLVHGVLRQ